VAQVQVLTRVRHRHQGNLGLLCRFVVRFYLPPRDRSCRWRLTLISSLRFPCLSVLLINRTAVNLLVSQKWTSNLGVGNGDKISIGSKVPVLPLKSEHDRHFSASIQLTLLLPFFIDEIQISFDVYKVQFLDTKDAIYGPSFS
jgi:hypothetical protein